MKLQFAFLADAANSLDKGMFDILGGGFDIITGKSFPATKHTIVLVGRILFEPDECGKKHKLQGRIVDGNSKPIIPEMSVELLPLPHPRKPDCPNWMTVFLTCQSVTFPTPGDYLFRLTIDNQDMARFSSKP